MDIVMMGVQGSGKGTQSKLLSKHLGLPHVSMGDLLRDHISRGTSVGLKAKAYFDKGELVPDSIVIDVVRQRLRRDDAKEGCLLDGFPRNGVQLATLALFRPVDRAVLLELDDETAVRRLAGRSECPECGIIYGANDPPKRSGICNRCGGPLKVRSDDTEAQSVRERLRIYHEENKAIVSYYERKGALRRVDAGGTVEEVFELVRKALER